LQSPVSNSCTVNGISQQITVTQPASIPGAITYQWFYAGNNRPNINGINCKTTTPSLSWTYQGGSCGFNSLPKAPGGGPAGMVNGNIWAQEFTFLAPPQHLPAAQTARGSIWTRGPSGHHSSRTGIRPTWSRELPVPSLTVTTCALTERVGLIGIVWRHKPFPAELLRWERVPLRQKLRSRGYNSGYWRSHNRCCFVFFQCSALRRLYDRSFHSVLCDTWQRKFLVCNLTENKLLPPAATLNWRVVR